MGPTIHVLVGSTREARRGLAVALWLLDLAQDAHPEVAFELVDLADWELPVVAAASPPILGHYADERTRRWAGKVAEADAFLVVTPEYNHGYPAVLKNALDLLFAEWNDKPVGFAGYGGPDGGTRAVEQLRQVVVELGMVPVRAQLTLPFVYHHVDDLGRFAMPDREPAARELVDEVVRRTTALGIARLRRAG